MSDWSSDVGFSDRCPCVGVCGMVGMLLTVVFAQHAVNSAVITNGLCFGETALFTAHIVALIVVSIFAFFGSLLLLKITDMISTLRVSEDAELVGLDKSQHDEEL